MFDCVLCVFDGGWEVRLICGGGIVGARLSVKKAAKKPAKKAAKDPNKPKRPPSAFFVFMYVMIV